ncbi:hypothetical protein Tco_0994117 [Tanacetum coccineum]
MEKRDTVSSCSDSEEQRMQQLKEKLLHIKDVQINIVNALNVNPVVMEDKCYGKEKSSSETAFSKSVNERRMNMQEGTVPSFLSTDDPIESLNKAMAFIRSAFTSRHPKTSNQLRTSSNLRNQATMKKGEIDLGKALDASLGVNESSGIESGKQDTSSKLGNDADADNADIKAVHDEEPMAKVQLTAAHNVLANGQHHAKQPEFNNEGRVYQNAEQCKVNSTLLDTQLFKKKDMVEKEVYNELLKRFSRLEQHCISLEIFVQQKIESLHNDKPCQNQDVPEFREFFEINDLKAQLNDKNTTISNLKKNIENLHEIINKAKIKHDIDVIETINFELEHSVAKLLIENEQLHKKNEHLKQTYIDIYDSIKKT